MYIGVYTTVTVFNKIRNQKHVYNRQSYSTNILTFFAQKRLVITNSIGYYNTFKSYSQTQSKTLEDKPMGNGFLIKF